MKLLRKYRSTAALLALTSVSVSVSPTYSLDSWIVGRFYPEKAHYVLGEPVFVALEISNRGATVVSIEIPSTESPCGRAHFAIKGLKNAGWGESGCPPGGPSDYCPSSTLRLLPRQRHIEHFPLNYWFQFDKPGTFDARLTYEVKVGPAGNSGMATDEITSSTSTQMEVTSAFPIVLKQGSSGELRDAFASVLRDLASKDETRRRWAVWSIAFLAPLDFENVILNLVKGDQGEYWQWSWGIEGLARLKTESASLALYALAENSPSAEIVSVLGQTEDRRYERLLVRLSEDPELLGVSLTALAKVLGKDALAHIVPKLLNPDREIRQYAVRALGYTGSRDAIPPLISALLDEDLSVRQHAEFALQHLTHHPPYNPCLGGGFVPPPPPPPLESDHWRREVAWWKENADRVTVYRWNQREGTENSD